MLLGKGYWEKYDWTILINVKHPIGKAYLNVLMGINE